MKENKVKIIICLIIMLVILGIASLILFLTKKEDDPGDIHESITEKYNYSLVYDINEYQTIYNCINNYYSFLNENQNVLLNLLFEDYKNENSITTNNLSVFVEKKYQNYGYTINEIEKYYNPYYAFYFIKGQYRLEELDDILEEQIVYDIVIEDIIHNTYAILPILNKNANFETIINQYHLENYDKEIKKNNYNEVEAKNMSEFNEALMYLNDLVANLVNDCNKAYNLVGETTKEKYSNIENFKQICNEYQKENVSPLIENFNIEYKEGKKNINIIDNYATRYNFIIKSIKDYSVDIIK